MGEQLRPLETDDRGLQEGNNGAFARVRLTQILSSRGLPQSTSPFILTESEKGPDIMLPPVIGNPVPYRANPNLARDSRKDTWYRDVPEAELDQMVADAYNQIPPVPYTQMSKQLRMSQGTLVLHLKRVRKKGMIGKRPRGWQSKEPHSRKWYKDIPRDEAIQRVANTYNQNNPPLSYHQMAQELHMSQGTLVGFLQQARDRGIIGKRRRGWQSRGRNSARS